MTRGKETEMNHLERPIFVIGVHRSGTTLLRYMLNSSPRIYISPESDFIPEFFQLRPRARMSDRQIARAIQSLFTEHRFSAEWEGEAPTPAQFITHEGAPTPTKFLSQLYAAYAHMHGAERWGDKTPIYTNYVDLIHTLFPAAQFIHILRDGRDVALSMLEKWAEQEIHVDVFFAARNYVRRTRAARNSGWRLGPQLYYEMHYEALVQDPENELRAVCEFLGEEYLPEMAQPQILGRKTIEPGSWNDPIRRPPNTASVQRWRKEMTPADLRLFQFVAGRQLEELGYRQVDAGRMPAQEIARLARLAVKYAVLQAGRRVLQAAGLFPPI